MRVRAGDLPQGGQMEHRQQGLAVPAVGEPPPSGAGRLGCVM